MALAEDDSARQLEQCQRQDLVAEATSPETISACVALSAWCVSACFPASTLMLSAVSEP